MDSGLPKDIVQVVAGISKATAFYLLCHSTALNLNRCFWWISTFLCSAKKACEKKVLA